MIDAKELRIGNWVQHASHSVIKKHFIGSPHQFGVKDFEYTDFYDPIPLSPEVLKACGFVQMKYEGMGYIGNAELNFGYPVLYLDKHNKLVQNCAVPNGYLFLNKYRIEVKYFHQLQNLFYALTQTELIYQPQQSKQAKP